MKEKPFLVVATDQPTIDISLGRLEINVFYQKEQFVMPLKLISTF